MNVGDRIRQLRKVRKMMTTELATLVNTSQQTISNYETNKSEPNIAMLESICGALDISFGDFFAPERRRLSPEMEHLLDSAHKLSRDQRVLLQQLMDNMEKH
jgi:HTH-type transcriptional regulator, repressor for puuD